MVEIENINVIKPKEEHLRGELWVGDAFLYRKKKQPDGTIKVYALSEKKVLKRYFANRVRSRLRNYLYSNECKRIDKRYSTYLIPSKKFAQDFKNYIDLLKEMLEDLENQLLEKAKKKGDYFEQKSIQKRINYLNKNWKKNKPEFNVMVCIPLELD